MHNKTIVELAALLDDGSVSSLELTNYYLDKIEAHNATLNAVITIDADNARKAAEAFDNNRSTDKTSPLSGIPIMHKDIFCTEGVKTSCGSKMLDNFIAPYDATVVTAFKQAGAINLGKANMDEFAMGSSNENSYYGAAKNPWDTSRVPGGSSGGSAVVVAAGLAPGATGTDTGGSIRQPAAYCGITGIKPTYGRVSRYGMIAFASSLDQGGPMAKTAEDCAHMLQTMAGFDERDSTSVDRDVDNYTASLNDSIEGLRIGIPKEYFSEGLDNDVASSVQSAVSELEKLGAVVSDISLPNQGLGIAAYYIVAPAECSSNLSRFDGVRFGHRCEDPVDLEDLYKRSRGEGFGEEVKRRILIGTYALSAGYYDAYYLKAQRIRRIIRDDFQQAFKSVDVIAGPTTPTTAFALGAAKDPVSMYLNDIYTITTNLAGLPGISLPCGFSQKMPVGLQLVSNYFNEAKLLNVGHQFQQVTDWHRQSPVQFS